MTAASDTPAPPAVSRVRRVTEYASIISGLGFFLSVAAQEFVFDTWHLDFLEIASPSDVIMSGLRTILPAVFFALGTVLFHRPISVIRNLIMQLIVVGVLLLSMVVVFLAFKNRVLDFVFQHSYVGACILGAFVGIGTFDPVNGKSRLDSLGNTVTNYLTVFVGMSLIVSGYMVIQFSQHGYLSSENIPLKINDIPATCKTKLYWMGERNMVLHCAGTDNYFVLSHPDKLLLGPTSEMPRSNGRQTEPVRNITGTWAIVIQTVFQSLSDGLSARRWKPWLATAGM